MSKYKTREELYNAYMNSSSGEWKKFIMGLTVPADEIDYPLYHLTENKPDNLNWVSNKKPRTTKKTDSNTPPHPICSEPLPPRISTAPTLEGCFGGIYPYLANTFQDKNIKEKEFYLYQAIPDKHARVLTPTTANNEWLVYDAFLTQEHCIFGKVTMVLVETIVIKNPELVKEGWTVSHPYDLDRYETEVWMPPTVVVNRTKATTHISYEAFSPSLNDELSLLDFSKETTMSTEFKLSPSKDVILSQLSLEAHQNPLQLLSEGLLNKFSLVLTKLNSLDDSIHSLVAGKFRTDVSASTVRRITEKNSYMQLAVLGVGVPDGFVGPLKPYMLLLESTLSKYLTIRKDVLIPAATQMSIVLSNPDKLQSATISPLKDVKFFTKEKEYFETHVKSFFSTNSQSDSIVFSRLFANNGEFMECAKHAESLENLGKQANKILDSIIDDISNLKDITNRLAVRIAQDKQTYGVNAKVANELATVITQVANEISFFSALMVLTEQAIGIMDSAVDKAG